MFKAPQAGRDRRALYRHQSSICWLALSVGALLLAGCASGAQYDENATAPSSGLAALKSPLMPSAFFADGGERFTAWRCTPSQDLVTTTPDDKRLRLWTTLGETELPRAVVGTGSRYELGGVSFWRQGRDAQVESDNGRLVCSVADERETTTRSEHPESIFYAGGNEPGWNVSLDRNSHSLTLVSDYGQAKDTFDYRVASVTNGGDARMVLVSDSGRFPMELDLRAGACFDDMSGKPWPVKVTLRYGSREFQGCGQGVEASR